MQNSTLPIQRLKALLQMEYESEKDEYRVQSEKMSISQKVKRGICWYPVTAGRSYYNSLNQLVVEIEQAEPDDIDHGFEYGRPVVFWTRKQSQAESTTTILPYVCTVSFVRDTNTSTTQGEMRTGPASMVVVLPSSQALIDIQNAEDMGVQLYFDETSYKTMFHALDDVINAKKNRLEELRDLFAGQLQPQKYTFQPIRCPWLNATQEAAVNEVLWAKDVAIVHGPPGTGKTTTLVEAIYETLRRENQVMVCAQSNMAVDWISEKLVDHGIPVLRIGNPTRVNDKMLSFTYERRFENHPDYPELWSIRKTIRQMRENRKKGDSIHQKIARLRDRATEIEMRIHQSLFDEARVVACTLVGSANKLLVRQRFSTLFIDEAAQALEPACWIAIRRAHRVILAGDHQQLPPTIKCYEAQLQGLGKTLMQRIVENQPACVTLLKVQYRMHEQIMRFSSEWFYQGCVEAAPTVRHRSILDYDTPILWIESRPTQQQTHPQPLPWREGSKGPSPMPLPCREGSSYNDSELQVQAQVQGINNGGLSTPLPTREGPGVGLEGPGVGLEGPGVGLEEHGGGSSSHGYINKEEAQLTLQTLENYIGKIGRQRYTDERLDVGIITPYRLQAQYLRSLLKKSETLKPIRNTITVNTVDGFQGQERDIILISLVRSNEHGQIGFLNDLRRMNVAITRARMKLIIIGDSDTLCRHAFYRKLKAYIDTLQEE